MINEVTDTPSALTFLMLESAKRTEQWRIPHLIAAGANPDADAVYMAASRGENDKIREFIHGGADPNGRVFRRPLEIATENAFPETVSLLIELGANSAIDATSASASAGQAI